MAVLVLLIVPAMFAYQIHRVLRLRALRPSEPIPRVWGTIVEPYMGPPESSPQAVPNSQSTTDTDMSGLALDGTQTRLNPLGVQATRAEASSINASSSATRMDTFEEVAGTLDVSTAGGMHLEVSLWPSK